MDLGKAPKRGIIYALFRDKVLFESYSGNLDESRFEENNLLELHLFDENVEYRWIRTRADGCKDMLISDEKMIVNNKEIDCRSMYEDIYVEEVLLSGKDADRQENLSDTVKVVNYISYDENDLLRISGYRLQEVR